MRLFRLAFDTFDSNNDGSIDFEEFLLAISATSQGDIDDRLAVAFDMYVPFFEGYIQYFNVFFLSPGTIVPTMVKSTKRNLLN